MPDEEFTEGGQPIYRYTEPEPGWTPAEPDFDLRQHVERHLTHYLGESASVLHEVISDGIHIDVYIYEPTMQRPFYTLVTSGMSDQPMTVPAGAEGMEYAELVIGLPAHWPMNKNHELNSQGAFADANNYWPIQMLKYLARMPHDYNSWLGWGHSIPNGDPPNEVANTRFVGTVIGPVSTLPDGFVQLETPGKTVWFYSLLPIYAEEMQFKLRTQEGGSALIDKLANAGVNEVLDIHRINVCAERKLGRH